MSTSPPLQPVDVVMLGTFGVWRRGTLQSRGLPLAAALGAQSGLRCAIVTTPWDDPGAAGVSEQHAGVAIFNTNQVNPSKAPLAVAEQLRLVRALNPRVVHVMKPKGFGGLTAKARGLLPERCRIVVDYDDWEGDGGWNDAGDYNLLARRLFAYQETHLLARADAVTAASTLLVERARHIRRGRIEDDVTFLPNGLDRSWLDKLIHATKPEVHDPPVVLLYSRFAEFTPGWFREFVAYLDRATPGPLRFDLIGEDDPSRLAGIELRNVTLRAHGFVERERLPGLLANATVALFPYEDTLINRSKQSVKLLELMAAGLPVVACDVGDITRIAGDAVEISAATTPAAVAASVLGLLGNAERRSELSRRARERARHFSIDRLAPRLASVYRQVGLPT